jgi:hemolysin III
MSSRCQTLGEEIANSVSHGIGLVASLAAAPFLMGAMFRRGDAVLILAAGIFAVTVVLLYLSSTLYHAMPESRAKRILQVIDHSAIYLLIAGTYTPFALGVLRGPLGWTLLSVVWLLAALGVALKTTQGIVWPRLSTALYLAMGWLALVAARPFLREVPLPGLLWITAGGLAYTAGVAFFAADRLRYRHFVWHLFVIAGTACHYIAILQYA